MKTLPCVIVQMTYASSSNTAYYYFVYPTLPRFENAPEYPYDQIKSIWTGNTRWGYWSPITLLRAFEENKVRSRDEVRNTRISEDLHGTPIEFCTQFDLAWEVERHRRWKGTVDASS